MESQDDPEKRIRDLERPLADAARASELSDVPQGAPAYPPPPPGAVPPPPPPMYGYGGPYGGPAPKPPSGNRMWWILGTITVIGVLALAGGIAAFAAHQLSGVRSIINSSGVTTTPVTTSPRTTTRSPRSSTSTPPSRTASPSTSPLPAQGAPLDVSGIDENKTIACNDNVVTVSGISNTIVITGHCASVSVSGMKNSVTVDAADSIEASGMNNQVTYHSGAPKISNSGVDNVVTQG
ncbi:DUF3060 domain-containing protein [Mycobacterium montefiorense]|uniref:Membrane protein n=1 Tax=Mycobacterium montefiorense TaxID=154654 RepID=A0ABQ0NMX4_9MYCO|nr:DUF3060 domain-containing protein [Mycobacterium montefiorense]GBG38136.1 membrane protein [Mycobacterium montefiorense]GKU33713.1 membrane protein [Mycobacterium montefiorense]GKU39485.1 membrane protein [Mycobacterium montefiorense]GKU44526.1 membrane protein [Mycobacterium montefiorense]GKU51659.1 membrane protein [Mycobacterium montefiorense]